MLIMVRLLIVMMLVLLCILQSDVSAHKLPSGGLATGKVMRLKRSVRSELIKRLLDLAEQVLCNQI